MAAPLKTCTTIEQRGVVRFLWAEDMAAKDIHKEYFRDWIKLIRESGPTDGVSTTRCVHVRSRRSAASTITT
jgi:hypothetical protein